MTRAEQFFENLLDIRKEELSRVLFMSAYLLLIIASYSVTKAVRDSLFVTKIGPQQLPYVYLLIAGAMGLVSLLYSRNVNRIGLRPLIRATSLIAISNLVLFWMVFRDDQSKWFYVLYVWTSLFGAITASQFWLLATHVFNAREARRVFGWIALGGILGGVIGGAMTNLMAHSFGTESLLLVCAVMMSATLIVLERVHLTDSAATKVAADVEEGESLFHQVRSSRHLMMISGLLTVAVIVEAFIDYEYKVVAKQSIVSKDQLTAFFGTITFYIGIFSLLFQVLVTNRILKRFGVGLAIVLLPIGLFAAFAAMVVRPALWTAGMLQLIDGGFSYSVHRSGMELLYLPIPPQTRNAVKGFIDTFVDRAGRAAGAVLLLVCTVVVSLSIQSLSLVACALIVVWIAMAIAIKREYTHSFRRALERKTIEPEALQLRNVDAGTMRTLVGMLSSSDDRHVLYALDLLAHTHPNRWRSHIDKLIRHPSGDVRARTIAVLASWNDPTITSEDFLHHPDYETARIAMASALRLVWSNSGRNRRLLENLLHDPSHAVAREAVRTAGLVGYREATPFLIEQLANRNLRRDTREALVRLGETVLPQLVLRLRDADENVKVRRRIPKAMALIGTQRAADGLIQHLHQLGYDLDRAILKGLNRLRATRPEITIDRDAVLAAITRERDDYDKLKNMLECVLTSPMKDAVFALLARAIAERRAQRIERIVRLVGLIYSPHDIHLAYYNYQLKPALRPAAIEFLDNLMEPDMKKIVLPVLEESISEGQTGTVRSPLQFISVAAVLGMLRSGDDPWLKTIADELANRLGAESDETREPRIISRR